MTASLLRRAALLGIALLACSGAALALDGVVSRISDGDTLWIKPSGGGPYVKLRVQGIDAPEICQAWGEQSKRALQAFALGQAVRVHGRLRDDHGRRLVQLVRSSDGEDLGARMVRDGHAWSYRYRDDAGPYLIEELAARAARRGLFAAGDAVVPRTFRRAHGACEMRPAEAGTRPRSAANHPAVVAPDGDRRRARPPASLAVGP